MTEDTLYKLIELRNQISSLKNLVDPIVGESSVIGIQYLLKAEEISRGEEMTVLALNDDFNQELFKLAKKYYKKYKEEYDNLLKLN